jgi:cell division protein FtsB
VTQSSVSLPPYLSASTAPAWRGVDFFPGLEAISLATPNKNSSRKNSSLRRLKRRTGQSNIVNLLLSEENESPAEGWPDELPFTKTFSPRAKKDFSNNVAVRTLKLGVGAGLLTILGCKSLIKGWNQSEIWVKNAVKSVLFSLLSLYLFVSSIALIAGMVSVHQEAPVVKGLYESHHAKNTTLKSEIKRIQSGEDAEALARGYLDMVKAGEVLLKIQLP